MPEAAASGPHDAPERQAPFKIQRSMSSMSASLSGRSGGMRGASRARSMLTTREPAGSYGVTSGRSRRSQTRVPSTVPHGTPAGPDDASGGSGIHTHSAVRLR